jgi:hypothetical protein
LYFGSFVPDHLTDAGPGSAAAVFAGRQKNVVETAQ